MPCKLTLVLQSTKPVTGNPLTALSPQPQPCSRGSVRAALYGLKPEATELRHGITYPDNCAVDRGACPERNKPHPQR